MRTNSNHDKTKGSDNVSISGKHHQRKNKPKEKNPEFVKFGQYIQTHRKAQKLTQAQLAAMLGITTKSVSYYECGFSFPKPQYLFSLVKILNLSLDKYAQISNAPQSFTISDSAQSMQPFNPSEFAVFLEALSTEERNHILSILKTACDTLPSKGA